MTAAPLASPNVLHTKRQRGPRRLFSVKKKTRARGGGKGGKSFHQMRNNFCMVHTGGVTASFVFRKQKWVEKYVTKHTLFIVITEYYLYSTKHLYQSALFFACFKKKKKNDHTVPPRQVMTHATSRGLRDGRACLLLSAARDPACRASASTCGWWVQCVAYCLVTPSLCNV